MSLVEARCKNPDCDRVTLVTMHPATLTDPGYPGHDICECGDWLDLEEAEPLSKYDIEELRHQHDDRI